MKKPSLQTILRVIALSMIAVGAFVGWDMGDKMMTVNQEVFYVFDFWLAALVWFSAFAMGVLFWAVARIIDLLEARK